MVKQIEYLSPSQIRFTQDSISDDFSDKSLSIEETFKQLLYGVLKVDDIKFLAAVEEDGDLWVVSGNRRLYIYKRLERHGVIDCVPVVIVPKDPERFDRMKTTCNEGTKVKIRSDRFYPSGQKLSDRLDRIYQEWNKERKRDVKMLNPGRENNSNRYTCDDNDATFIHSVIDSNNQIRNHASRSLSQRRALSSNNSAGAIWTDNYGQNQPPQSPSYTPSVGLASTETPWSSHRARSATPGSRTAAPAARPRSAANEAARPRSAANEADRHSSANEERGRSRRRDKVGCCTIL